MFADIIREGVPADRFCAEGLSRVLPSILKAQGINVDNVSIRIESSGTYNTCSLQTKKSFLRKKFLKICLEYYHKNVAEFVNNGVALMLNSVEFLHHCLIANL